jgi:hypothetical protein
MPTWKCNDVPDSLNTGKVAEKAIEAHPETAMRGAAPSAEIDIPVQILG